MATPTDDDLIAQHVHAFGRWADNNIRSRSVLAPGSAAEADDRLAGGAGIVTSGIVEGLINSATDHLLSWRDKCFDSRAPNVVRLSAYADYTLLRSPIESLANLLWILQPETSLGRVTRTLRLINIELQHGKKLIRDLAAAGTPDPVLSRSFAAAEPRLIAAAIAAGIDADTVLGPRVIEQSKILRSIGSLLGGPTHDALVHWARGSAHAHSQTITALTLAHRTVMVDETGPFLYAELDSRSLRESCDLLLRLCDVTVQYLNRRGYTRLHDSDEVPGRASDG
jgi:hypothetical protein